MRPRRARRIARLYGGAELCGLFTPEIRTKMKLGQKVTVSDPNGDYKATIVAKMKFEAPFSAFRKKGTDYIVEKDDGQQARVSPDRISA